MKSFRLRRRPEVARYSNRSRPQVESLESRELLSVTVGQAHAGLGYTGAYPPDTIGAVGPNYYVEEVNTTIAIYNKSTGSLVRSQGMGAFFNSLGGVQQLSDPFVGYDQIAGKFFTGILDFNNSDSRIDFAVSNTSDPTGTWTYHRYDTTNDGSSNHLTDYPRFGYNREAYVISYNQFGNTSVHVDTLAISKSNLATSYTHVWPTGTIAAPGMSPTIMHDAAANGPMWFVGLGASTSIKVIKMTNVLSSSPTITPYTVTVPSYSAAGSTFHQPGGTFSVQIDSRILNAAMYGGKLVAAHTTGITGGYHQARWYEFNTTGSSPTLATSGQVTAASRDDYYPTVDINSSGAIGMTYMENSSSEYMSMWVTGRTASDPAGQMETGMSPTAVHGTGNYANLGRAGDYSGMSVDPSDNTTFWAANQFKGSSTWNTGVVRFSLGGSTIGPATHYSVAAATTSVAGNAFDVTVTALDANENVASGYRGTVTFSSADPYGATLPGDYTFTAADNGVHTFSSMTALYTTGLQDVTTTDTSDGSITGSATVRVTAAALDHFVVTTSADGSGTIAGNAFDVTVTAQDAYNNRASNYTGIVTFSSADPYGASLPADYHFTTLDGGAHLFRGVTALYTAGYEDVTVTDTTTTGGTGSDYVLVIAAPATSLYIAAPSSAASGAAFDVTVYAVDPYGNTDTNYGGTVTWTTTDGDPGVVLPADYTFQSSDQGVVTFAGGVTLITQGDQLITATDTGSGITGSADVTVTPGPNAVLHGHKNAALALALPQSAPAVVPTSSSAADRSTASSAVPTVTGQGEAPVKPALREGDVGGLVAPVDSLSTAVLDLVLAEWNDGLNLGAVAV